MWLFSPSTGTGSTTNNARNAYYAESNNNSKADEESCCSGGANAAFTMEGAEEFIHELSQRKGNTRNVTADWVEVLYTFALLRRKTEQSYKPYTNNGFLLITNPTSLTAYATIESSQVQIGICTPV